MAHCVDAGMEAGAGIGTARGQEAEGKGMRVKEDGEREEPNAAAISQGECDGGRGDGERARGGETWKSNRKTMEAHPRVRLVIPIGCMFQQRADPT